MSILRLKTNNDTKKKSLKLSLSLGINKKANIFIDELF